MKFNKTLLAAALFGAMGISTAAQAITVQGITFAEGANFEFMEIAESEQPGFGNGNGIVDQVGEHRAGHVGLLPVGTARLPLVATALTAHEVHGAVEDTEVGIVQVLTEPVDGHEGAHDRPP